MGSTLLKCYFVYGVFINTDCNKRGQTSRLVAGAQIQTLSGNFETNTYSCNWFMDYVHCRSFYNLLEFSYNFMVSTHRYSSVSSHTKIFLSLRHNQIHVQNHVAQGQPSQAIPLNIARYRKAVYSALWVQGTLVICYLPYVVVVALQPQRGMSLSIYHAQQFTATLLYSNSSLNPLLYCWKIREVRQAVKETLRQLSC